MGTHPVTAPRLLFQAPKIASEMTIFGSPALQKPIIDFFLNWYTYSTTPALYGYGLSFSEQISVPSQERSKHLKKRHFFTMEIRHFWHIFRNNVWRKGARKTKLIQYEGLGTLWAPTQLRPPGSYLRCRKPRTKLTIFGSRVLQKPTIDFSKSVLVKCVPRTTWKFVPFFSARLSSLAITL